MAEGDVEFLVMARCDLPPRLAQVISETSSVMVLSSVFDRLLEVSRGDPDSPSGLGGDQHIGDGVTGGEHDLHLSDTGVVLLIGYPEGHGAVGGAPPVGVRLDGHVRGHQADGGQRGGG